MSKIVRPLWFNLAFIAALVVTLAFGSARPVQAAVMDPDGVIEANEVVDDDVFLSGDAVRMDGTVKGMLVASGNTITINGTVNGDVFAFGNRVVVSEGAVVDGNLFGGASSVEVHGQVGGSVAVGSATLAVGEGAAVARNLYYGGYALEAAQNTTVGRSLYSATYQTKLAGDVAMNVGIAAAAVELTGKVGGDAVVDLGDTRPGDPAPQMGPYFAYPGAPQLPPALQPGLRMGPKAEVGGKLTYTSGQPMTGVESAVQGGVVYQTPVPNQKEPAAPVNAPRTGANYFNMFLRWLLGVVRNLLTLLLMGLLAVRFVPRVVAGSMEQTQAKPGHAAGYGLLTWLVGYVGAGLAVLAILAVGIFFAVVTLGALSRTVFGIGFSSLAVAFALFTLLVSYGSKLVVAYLVGNWLMGKLAPLASGRPYWAMTAGVVIYVLLRAIPFLGWVIGAAATLVGLGALVLVYQTWRKQRLSPVTVTAEAV